MSHFAPALAGVVVGLVSLFGGGPALAINEWEIDDGAYTMEAIGSGRLTGAFFHYPAEEDVFPADDDGLGAGVLRLILEGGLGYHVGYEINIYSSLARSGTAGLGGAFDRAGSATSPYRYPHLSLRYWEDGSVQGELGIDRFVFQVSASPLLLTVGRMPINHGVTSIFVPNDFFAPFAVAAINTVYKPGVDGLKIGIETGMQSGVELVGVLGYGVDGAPDWAYSALLLRARRVFGNCAWALLGGKLAGRWIVGASMQGELGPLGVRGEGHLGFRDRDGLDGADDLDGDGPWLGDAYTRFALGLDMLFAWQNASIVLEYFFQSDGIDGPKNYWQRLTSLFPDDQLFFGKHYVGLNFGLDIIPILRFNSIGILNAADGSGLAGVSLAYNISDESDFILGMFVPWGKRPEADNGLPDAPPVLHSEFGILPLTVYLESRFYF